MVSYFRSLAKSVWNIKSEEESSITHQKCFWELFCKKYSIWIVTFSRFRAFTFIGFPSYIGVGKFSVKNLGMASFQSILHRWMRSSDLLCIFTFMIPTIPVSFSTTRNITRVTHTPTLTFSCSYSFSHNQLGLLFDLMTSNYFSGCAGFAGWLRTRRRWMDVYVAFMRMMDELGGG